MRIGPAPRWREVDAVAVGEATVTVRPLVPVRDVDVGKACRDLLDRGVGASLEGVLAVLRELHGHEEDLAIGADRLDDPPEVSGGGPAIRTRMHNDIDGQSVAAVSQHRRDGTGLT